MGRNSRQVRSFKNQSPANGNYRVARLNKYRNLKTEVNGEFFDSKFEANIYQYLKSKFGNLVQRQPKVYLTKARILFKPDFKVQDIFFEAKGKETAVYRIKRRLWKYYGPGVLCVYFLNGKHELICPEKSSSP